MRFPLTLTLNKAGVPIRWATYQEVANYFSRDLVKWTFGDNSFKIFGGYQRGKQTELEIPSIISIEGHPHFDFFERTPHLSNRALFRRDQKICAYCGVQFGENSLTRDHINPKSKNGLNTWTNCVACCARCNSKKGNRTPEEAGMKLLYVPYAPDNAEYLILLNKKILGDQMDFLKSQIKNKNSRIISA